MRNEIRCNYKIRFFIVSSDEIEFHLPHFDNIVQIEYENIAEIWNQIYENKYIYNENDRELLQVLIESGIVK